MKPPIFVIGSGRSGTTLLYNILTGHEDLAWVSNLSNRLPMIPAIVGASRFNKLRSLHRVFQPAMETIEGYNHIGLDRSTIPWDPSKNVVTNQLAEKTRNYFEAHCRAWRREQLVSKNTSNSTRIHLLDEIFPDARYVHIHRHPYSVISSLLNVGFWSDLDLWWSDKTPQQLELAGADAIEVAAEHWNRQMQAILASADTLPESRFIQLSYEDLVSSPETVCEKILNFLDLKFSDEFRENIKGQRVQTSSLDKWKQTAEIERFVNANPKIAKIATQLQYELAG